MTEAILSYHQADSIKLLCEIDLKKIFPASAPKERDRFNKNWNDFLKSDPCNKEIFELKGDLLKYQSEQLIPSKSDDRPPSCLFWVTPPAIRSKPECSLHWRKNGYPGRVEIRRAQP